MPKKITYTATRPSVEISFYSWPASVSSYIKTLFNDTGKVINQTITMSEDGLTLTVVTLWQNGAFEEAANDPIISEARMEQNQHNLDHNIVTTSLHEDVE